MKVAVVGLSYTGTVTATCLAANDHEVWEWTSIPRKWMTIQAGRSQAAEPGFRAMVVQAVASEGLGR